MDNLTYKEKQVVKHIQEGCTNKEIASRICISHETVKAYLRNIYIKTGTNNRVKLAIYAERSNLQLKTA